MAGKKKLELKFIRQEFLREGYRLLVRKYKNCSQKLLYICPKGHKHSICWGRWSNGNRCPSCDGQGKPDIKMISLAFESEGYKLLSNEYVNDAGKLWYLCPEGHLHSMRWGNFRNGKRCPDCSKIEQNLQITGENHYNWKGGVTRFNKELRNFVRHIGWVNKVFKRDGYTCQKCLIRGGYLIAHHIMPLSAIRKKFNIKTIDDAKNCDLIYDISNGITFCKKCHKLIHDKFYIRRNLELCLMKEFSEKSNGLYEPFVREILRRNPSNSGEALTSGGEGNPERSPKGNVQRLEHSS
jgi:hypothetical protein